MITIGRGILACSVLTMLSGCTAHHQQCGPPNEPSHDPPITCLYQIQVISKDPSTNSVTGKVPDVLVVKDEHGDRTREFEAPKSAMSENEYTFRINHFEKLSDLIVIGRTYEFMRIGNHPEFGLGKEIVHEQKK